MRAMCATRTTRTTHCSCNGPTTATITAVAVSEATAPRLRETAPRLHHRLHRRPRHVDCATDCATDCAIDCATDQVRRHLPRHLPRHLIRRPAHDEL